MFIKVTDECSTPLRFGWNNARGEVSIGVTRVYIIELSNRFM